MVVVCDYVFAAFLFLVVFFFGVVWCFLCAFFVFVIDICFELDPCLSALARCV